MVVEVWRITIGLAEMIQLVVSCLAHDFHTCESWHKLVDWYRCIDISGHHRNESGRQSYQCVVFIVCMKDEEKLPPLRFCRLECLTVWPLPYGTSGADADRGELTERVLQLFLRGGSVLAQAPRWSGRWTFVTLFRVCFFPFVLFCVVPRTFFYWGEECNGLERAVGIIDNLWVCASTRDCIVLHSERWVRWLPFVVVVWSWVDLNGWLRVLIIPIEILFIIVLIVYCV